MPHTPIYLHSSWRSSSTYVWSKFRELPQMYSYFEPLGEHLGIATPQVIQDFVPWSYANHPPLSRPYHDEFMPLLAPEGGVFGFPDRLVYGRYRLDGDEDVPELARYFSGLCAFAEGLDKTAVFGLVRSSLRVNWFRRHCPGIHIYILRDPRRQFMSFARQVASGSTYFLERWMVILGNNLDDPVFQPLIEAIQFPRFTGESGFRDTFYTNLARNSQPAVTYKIFYYMHLLAVRSFTGRCDLVIDVDTLSGDADYRRGLEQSILDLTGTALSFADCRPETYDAMLQNADGFFAPVEAEMAALLETSLARI